MSNDRLKELKQRLDSLRLRLQIAEEMRVNVNNQVRNLEMSIRGLRYQIIEEQKKCDKEAEAKQIIHDRWNK